MAQNTFDFSHFWSNLSTILAGKQATLTTAQQAAADSGITSAKVGQYDKDSAATSELVNGGAKNFLHFDSISTTSSSTVTFTLNSNGTVTASAATPSASLAATSLTLNGGRQFIDEFCNGNYVLSGCPSGGGSSSYEFLCSNSGGTYIKRDYGNGVVLSDRGTFEEIYVQITIRAGFSGSITFKPMICTKAQWDVSQAYEPYALPNAPITSELIELVDTGAKNFVDVRFSSKAATSNMPSATNNGDGSVTINGTRTGSTTVLVYDIESDAASSMDTRYTLPAGRYVVAATGSANIKLQVYAHDGTNIATPALAQASTDPVEFEYDSATKTAYPYIVVRINIDGSTSGISYDNVKFYPMICTKSAWDVSQAFVPYCPSMAEMYEMIKALQT